MVGEATSGCGPEHPVCECTRSECDGTGSSRVLDGLWMPTGAEARFAGPLFKYFPLILSPWFIFGARLTAADVVAAKYRHRVMLPPAVRYVLRGT
eukprot:1065642-Rhodomonas_salina.2